MKKKKKSELALIQKKIKKSELALSYRIMTKSLPNSIAKFEKKEKTRVLGSILLTIYFNYKFLTHNFF